MKTKSIFIIACFVLAVITSFAQTTISSSTKKINCPPAWLLKGNSGIDTSKNFIGTRDAQPLLFKVNNHKAGYLDSDSLGSKNTSFGYQSLSEVVPNPESAALSAFGYRALYLNTTGYANTACGTNALYFNTTGDINTAIGAEALFSNTEGAFNTAIAYDALFSNTTAIRNTATGSFAIFANTTGPDNTAVGYFALFSNATGDSNTATGYDALVNNTTGASNITRVRAGNAMILSTISLVVCVTIGTPVSGQYGWPICA